MQDYPLEELGPRAFEQLAVALSVKVLGPGVEAFGSGPDGGREATYEGRVNWSATSEFGSDSWDGYVVIQAKQREHPADPQSNAVWLRRQIELEFDRWMSEGSKRGQFPQYIVFVTNVRLSSAAGTGGIDSINEVIRKRIHRIYEGEKLWLQKAEHQKREQEDDERPKTLEARGLRGWKIWHRDQINALLNVEEGIRRAFPAMLTAGDILARLEALSGPLDPQELHPVLTAHAWKTLKTERWVNFSEGGGGTRQSVEKVIVDLRVDGSVGQETTALSEIIRRGDTVLKASMAPAGEQRHIVLTGSPGNGKTTVSRFITQLYRTRFMANDARSDMAEEIMDGTRSALGRLGLPAPKNRRWPIRVDLAELADDLGPSGGKSLLRWLSERVTLRAEIDVKPVVLKQWLRCWPWLLILDGLDEVTSPEVRRRILDEIESFVEEADHIDADLLVVVTTRPTGYTERIAPRHFTQFDLRYFDGESAVEYGRLVTTLRLADDLDRRDLVLERFEQQATEPTMVRLMKTPLQVLIMTFILERFGNLLPDRYQLFWRYYEAFYDRESAKNTALASLLLQHRSSITDLHEAVGLTLQVRAETSTDARALLPMPELRSLAEARMLELGHEAGPDTSTLADKIVTASTQRLVLLVPAEHNTVTFEIRSLEELMAGRALSNGTDDEVRRRLRVTAPSPHWRNTWVFTAGRLYSEGPDHRRDLVTEVVESIDKQPDWPGWLCPVGPGLAANLLDDGLAAITPKWQRRLLDVALRSLTDDYPQDPRGLVRGLTAAAATGNNLMYIRSALKRALASTPRSHAVATKIVALGEFGSAISGMIQPPTWQSGDSISGLKRSTTVAELLRPRLADIQESTDTLTKVENALTELRRLKLQKAKDGTLRPMTPNVTAQWPCNLEALRDPGASLVISLLCGDLDADLWQAQELLAQAVWPELSRAPVGQHLLSFLAHDA